MIALFEKAKVWRRSQKDAAAQAAFALPRHNEKGGTANQVQALLDSGTAQSVRSFRHAHTADMRRAQ